MKIALSIFGVALINAQEQLLPTMEQDFLAMRSELSALENSGKEKTNDRPMIGILTQPMSDSLVDLEGTKGFGSFVAMTYVDSVKSAGARVVPLIYDEPIGITLKKLDSLNGVLFPGGSANKGPY